MMKIATVREKIKLLNKEWSAFISLCISSFSGKLR